MYYLKLTLAGVLQSWGSSDTFWPTFRDTELLPTTTGVTGLICCALGVDKLNPIHDKVSQCQFLCLRNNNLEKLSDYQIVSPREYKQYVKDSRFWTVDGGHGGLQLPFSKSYLLNSEFTVYLGNDDIEFLRDIYQAFLNPKYNYFLGRACCTPSKPIVEKEFITYSDSELLERSVTSCIYTC